MATKQELVKVSKAELQKAAAAVTSSKVDRKLAFKRLLSLSYPEWFRIVMGISALMVNAITNLSFPWIMGQAIDKATGSDTLSHVSPEYMMFIAKATGVFMCGSIASWVRVYCLGTSTDRIAYKLRKLLFNGYVDKNLEFFDTAKSGEMVTVMEKDVVIAAQTLTDKLAAGIRALNSAINGSFLLFSISPKLCAVSLGVVPFVGIGAMSIHRIAKKFADRLRNLESSTLSFAIERLQHMTTVRVNGQESREKQRFRKSVEDCYQLTKSHYFTQGALMGFIGMATNASLLAILYVGGNMLAKKEMTPGTLTRFAIQSAFVGLGFSGLSTFYSDMNKSLDAAGRVFQQIDVNASQTNTTTSNDYGAITTTSTTTTTTTVEKKNTEKSAATTTSGVLQRQPSITGRTLVHAQLKKCDGDISVNDVTFAYASRPDQHIFQHFYLTINPKNITSIVGRSGIGKSTLLGLLCGLLQPTEGSICMDRVNIQDISANWLREHIGVVEQGSVGLFSGSIFENIAYGYCPHHHSDNNNTVTTTTTTNRRRTDSNMSILDDAGEDVVDEATLKELVMEAAKKASAHEFILSFPEGYETMVGESGKMLSGGQKARILLARALIKKPVILLLDEATAALDSVHENEILDILVRLKVTTTIIAFTHSAALMQLSDSIHVLGKPSSSAGNNNNVTTIVASGVYDDVKHTLDH